MEPTKKRLQRLAAKQNATAPAIQYRVSDVFLTMKCSECGADLGTYRGHASLMQKELFATIRLHNPVCGKVRALCGEQAR